MMKSKIMIILIVLVGSASVIGWVLLPPHYGGLGLYPTLNATDRDRAKLIRLTLERAIVDKEIPDYQLIGDNRNIVLSTENIRKKLVPRISGVKLMILDDKQIQEKADEEGDFAYLRFSRLNLQNPENAVVQLDITWAKSKESPPGPIGDCGGFTIFYKKVSGRWEGEVAWIWIS